MSVGIAFEGCAIKVAFHIGVLQYIKEQGISLDMAAGASSGSIPATALAVGLPCNPREQWLSFMGARLVDLKRVFRGKWPTTLREFLLEGIAGYFGNVRLNELSKPLAIPVTQFGWKGLQRKVYTHENNLSVLDVILATCHLPGFYSKVFSLEKKISLDGAWQIRTPVADLTSLGAKKTIACVTNTQGLLYRGFFWQRSMPVPENCRVLYPIEPVTVGPFDVSIKAQYRAIAIGRRSAQRFFDTHQQWLWG